jgi:hypothetical protein
MDDIRAANPEQKQNWRDGDRPRTLLGATLVYGPDLLTVDCTIRDRTDRGVRIELPTMVLLPERFWMIEHRLAVAHEAKLVWRRGNLVGLELLARRGLDSETDPNLRRLRRIWMEKAPRAAFD